MKFYSGTVTLRGIIGARIGGDKIWEAILRMLAHTGWATKERKRCRFRSVLLEFHKRIQAGEVVAEICPADTTVGGNGQSRR